MGKAKKIGIGVGIVVAAFFGIAIAAALAASDSETISQDTSTLAAADGRSVRVYDLTFRVVNATQDGRLITVIVNVENHGSGIELVSWLDFRLIDGQKNLYEDARPFPPDSGTLAAMGEIAPGADRDFKYVFRVPEGTPLTDCQLVVLEDLRNPSYLSLS